jgi:hypothetical protein
MNFDMPWDLNHFYIIFIILFELYNHFYKDLPMNNLICFEKECFLLSDVPIFRNCGGKFEGKILPNIGRNRL